ncbi:MAG: DNA repair protein RecO [Candidatus Lloydbacteria bacterium RIFCSPHIGHO2_02_FULL_54_17]|uniref:DNA repair protein RecO n=1 Tax=Candidatus Lloydbacteria bacterium RIFCSPHIGHO2_02_FULL_54_17 TaxID=1798664 RepID=A0A1G2DDS3_9BACT|nr:MAG: DNA repair protein RecO [Candidatus Lloydbacteria bacterium RIFCSPHIGHO2_01_FULL_54_11]OGZ11010.1 MAG: DNA repair protein RecO [Candidatus Lloydbacteria bacterium RIFCSPHIGHO2_02_FULL_54_17]OGZ13161.1 MAG: DNA repair protein RecO [Candidatus Lloydbacteria bacterium RIFCSPLOWO2_01_FULL_54_18]
MSYHVYHTEALVLSARPVGEGDRLFHCYTRDLGLVSARAKSVRETRSRLRYALQTFAHAEIDLVEGKSGWRLISARPISSFRSLWEDSAKRRIAAELTLLVRRLIQGEERHAELFEDILLGLSFLDDIEEKHVLPDAELLLVVRLVALLGYWKEADRFAPLFRIPAYSLETLRAIPPLREELLKGVNHALQSSHL